MGGRLPTPWTITPLCGIEGRLLFCFNDTVNAFAVMMEEDSEIRLKTLKVDGGATANNFLMQFQSDILGVEVQRPEITETTALGAAYLAGLATGFWKSEEMIMKNWAMDKAFKCNMSEESRSEKYTMAT